MRAIRTIGAMRIMIGALSCWKYKDRRDRCEQTWMQEGDTLDGTPPGSEHRHTIVRSVFLIGSPGLEEPALAGRNLLLPGPSNYQFLPQRTRAFCQWAIARDDWDYLFKCDDDTYVAMPRLVRYPLTADYIGAEWRPGVRYASGGAGYFLSRKAAAAVAEHLTQKEGPEDVYVRDALASQGIPFTQDQRFVAVGDEELRPRAGNDLITLHCVPSVPAALFYKTHQECTGGEPFDPPPVAPDPADRPTRLDPDPPLSTLLSPEDLRCLKEGQRQLTRMLKYLFEEVCEPHGIQALAWGGTLIGAVNYGGWVPWDADADILVHRDDFERFKAQIRASCPADFWYQSRDTDPHYEPVIEKLRYLHAHYTRGERFPWHGGLQVDICQFWFEDGVFVTSAPDNAVLGGRLREQHILPSIELLFDGVRLRTFRDPAAYLRVRYRTEPLQSERNVPVEARYPHEGAVRLGASAADRARYPQLYEDQS
jgi:LicD family